MTTKISRRELLRNAGAAGMAGALLSGTVAPVALAAARDQDQDQDQQLSTLAATSSAELLREHENHQIVMEAGEMVIHFDRRYGSITSITRKGDLIQTNYIGNAINTPGVDASDSRWMGDVVSTVWRLTMDDWRDVKLHESDVFRISGQWERELTGKSKDIRRIVASSNSVEVKYQGRSTNELGLQSYNLNIRYRPGAGNSLLWDIEIENTTGKTLEIGELGLPFMVNDDYGELFIEDGEETKLSAINNVGFSKTPLRQKLIHEQKVLVHNFTAGHSSYALVERPLGDPPFLLFHTTGDTSLECIYKEPHTAFAAHVVHWAGPDILAIHSRATEVNRGWGSNPWMNGHTSLVLEPGEKKAFHFRFAFIPSYEAIRDEICNAGNLGIRVLPSMVIQEGTDALVELQANSDIGAIDLLSDNITVKDKKRIDGKTLLTLSFKGRGQKSLKIHYGDRRWTDLHFYSIQDVEASLKERGRFIIERQFYTNPDDPFHRNHCFMPFDYRIGSMFLDSDRVWEVGGSDECGFSEPLFLSLKNVYLPVKDEIATLETYVSDCLFKYIQNPETYEVRASLYWKDRVPSDPWSEWSEKRAATTFRTYNYVHPANIYHALYRIGKSYGLLTHRTAEDYLRMSYRTCLKWFTTGPWMRVGLMEGSNAIEILGDLEIEGWTQEAEALRKLMKECEEEFVYDPYPYGSELSIDQTAHEQVYFFTRYFGDKEKNTKTIQVLKALRGGNQPVWFRYGNDKRRDVCCWYTASLNGSALLQAYEDHGDPDALLKGYAGVMSVMANVTPDGMGYNQFICTPGIFDYYPPRTFESGSGLWGFLKAAKSYVVEDPVFGEVGYGCKLEATQDEVVVHPRDGLKKRLRFVARNIDISVLPGQIQTARLHRKRQSIQLEISDPSTLAKEAVITIRGLSQGEYSVRFGRSRDHISVNGTGTFKIKVPMAEANHVEIEKA